MSHACLSADNAEFERRSEHLVDSARWFASDHAVHYNGHHVGACFLVARGGDRGPREYGEICAANVKPHKDTLTQCAERTGMPQVKYGGWTRVAAIVIHGRPREEDTASTLRPCERCRPWLDAMPEIDDDTILLCVYNGSSSRMTWGELMREYPNDCRCEQGHS